MKPSTYNCLTFRPILYQTRGLENQDFRQDRRLQRAVLREAPEVHRAEQEVRALHRAGPLLPDQGELRRGLGEKRLQDTSRHSTGSQRRQGGSKGMGPIGTEYVRLFGLTLILLALVG